MDKNEFNYDVLVAGGGIAGISAALASARCGAKTVLIEKECILGGLATSGLITIYLPLCDGMGNQVIYGIGEELLRLSVKRGYQDKYPSAWLDDNFKEGRKNQRFEVQYNPQFFAIDCEALLKEANVTIFYDTRIVETKKEDDKITEVIAYNKGGKSLFYPKVVIDATGDADICAMSLMDTKRCETGNKLAAWYYYNDKSGLHLNMLGASDSYEGEISDIDKNHKYSGLDGLENSKMIIRSHQHMLKDILLKKKKDETTEFVTIPGIMQLRKTRKLVGKGVIDSTDIGKRRETSIGLTGDWRKKGPVYEIPFEVLHNGDKMKNLLVAGRMISVTDSMWEITRVIPTCAVTGEAVGTAGAIISKKYNGNVNDLKIIELQNKLKENKVKIHIDEI